METTFIHEPVKMLKYSYGRVCIQHAIISIYRALLVYYIRFVTTGRHPTAQIARDLGITLNLLWHSKQEVAGDSLTDSPAKDGAHPRIGAGPTQAGLGYVTQERDFLKRERALAKYATNLGYLT